MTPDDPRPRLTPRYRGPFPVPADFDWAADCRNPLCCCKHPCLSFYDDKIKTEE